MTGLSSIAGRITSAISGLSNAVLGQTRSQARLNAIASYDQSNALFKVRSHLSSYQTQFPNHNLIFN